MKSCLLMLLISAVLQISSASDGQAQNTASSEQTFPIRSGSTPAPKPTPPKPHLNCQLNAEDYKVYHTVLAQLGKVNYTGGARRGKHIVLQNMTANASSILSQIKSRNQWAFHPVSGRNPADDVRKDFEDNIADQCAIPSHFSDTNDVSLISHESFDKLFRRGAHQDDWQTFHKQFPDAEGILAFSRTGFNPARTEAELYVAYHCGLLCGTGQLILLRKQGGAWNIVSSLMLWIS